MMKKTLCVLAASLVFSMAASSAWAAKPTPVDTSSNASGEDWKGEPETSEVNLGALTGMGILDEQVGFALLGTVSKKIVHHGFISDVNDSVSIEAAMGPLFVSGSTAFMYSMHLRWNFQKDEHWTFYALGGAGGVVTGASLGSRFTVLPRFGVGTFYHFNELFMIRGEISHDLIAAGVTFPFWL